MRIYDLQDDFTTAALLFTLDVSDGAATLLGLPTWYELASVEQGNLADDLLVGGASPARQSTTMIRRSSLPRGRSGP